MVMGYTQYLQLLDYCDEVKASDLDIWEKKIGLNHSPAVFVIAHAADNYLNPTEI